MAVLKHSPEEIMDFHTRRANLQVLPRDYVKKLLKKDESLNINKIQNVRYGKTIDFDILKMLEDLQEESKEKLTK